MILLSPPGAAAAQPLSVAGAANLSFALKALDEEFAREQPDVTVTAATGASGDLVAQIEHGAPYDVFLSADLHFAQVLTKAGAADPKSLTVFAVGRLVLWTTKAGVAVDNVAATVRDPKVMKLAIANTDTAPYGRAAKQAMEKLGAWTDAQPKLVVGESISQTTQFIETGNADAGFTALSVVLSPKLKGKGRWSEVSSALYYPLEQGAVVTSHGAQNPAAERYIAFLHGDAAKKILQDFGYKIPGA
ncbi:MAG TPA: molybdate ABC transporter substrate-binding protein [Opitutaceae bacterium]|nr:molybdate ABC transporter substrate-binding protein [Opitutaceae bacterium]